MIDRRAQIDRIEEEWPRPPLELEAEGHFHFILGTKDEHDGVKIYASNPRVIRAVLEDDEFRPDQYYCTMADESRAILEPDELAEHDDEVESIHAVDGMLPYDAVTISAADEELTAADVIAAIHE